MNYALVVTVTDGNGDGSVVVEFDTDAAGEDGVTKVTTRDDADGATVESETEHLGDEPPYPPLDAGEYPVALYEGTGDDRLFVVQSEMRILESETTAPGKTTDATTDEPTATTTTDIVTEPEPTEATETTSDGTDSVDGVGDVPGFGPALTLVALAAAAMLAARR